MEKELGKKSYKLFVTWIISYVLVVNLSARSIKYIGTVEESIYSVKVIGTVTLMMLCILFFIVYRTEKVYWINGTSYQEALKATSTQRKNFAKRHLNRFVLATVIYMIYCALGLIVVTDSISDTWVLVVAILAAGLSTIPIKLE